MCVGVSHTVSVCVCVCVCARACVCVRACNIYVSVADHVVWVREGESCGKFPSNSSSVTVTELFSLTHCCAACLYTPSESWFGVHFDRSGLQDQYAQEEIGYQACWSLIGWPWT